MILPVSGGMRKANKTKHITCMYMVSHGIVLSILSKFLKVLIKYPVLLYTKKQ